MPLKTTDWQVDADDGALCKYYLPRAGGDSRFERFYATDTAALVEESQDGRFSWYAYSSDTQGDDCIIKQGKRYSQRDAKKAADKALQQIIAANKSPEPAPWPKVVEALAALGWTPEAVRRELERPRPQE